MSTPSTSSTPSTPSTPSASGTGSTGSTTGELVRQYAAVFNARYGTAHGVSSPLGAWLLLALAGPATDGAERAALEEILGTSVDDAHARAAQLLADPHPAVEAAVAAWADQAALVDSFEQFARQLPAPVEQGPIPTQAAADAWAAAHTHGMIEQFPLEITSDTALVLASALATDVSWRVPLERVRGTDLGGPFGEGVERALRLPARGAIVDTDAAGLVAVASSPSTSGLTVYSVIAAPDISAARVHEAAHAVAALMATPRMIQRPAPGTSPREVPASGARRVDLFDLPLTDGHAWTLTERTEVRQGHGGRVSEYEAYLPAWEARSSHELADGPGVAPVLASLARLVRPEYQPASTQAKQTARAEYTAEGFKAAAVTAFGALRSAGMMSRAETQVRRAVLRLNREHAVVAVADLTADGRRGAWTGVPVFSAWVADPAEA